MFVQVPVLFLLGKGREEKTLHINQAVISKLFLGTGGIGGGWREGARGSDRQEEDGEAPAEGRKEKGCFID